MDYNLAGDWWWTAALSVNSSGHITLQKPLDREAPGGVGAVGKVQLMASDQGTPPLTSTATLTITVTDVNDCAPELLPPTVFHVTEGGAETKLGTLMATDRDVWAMGHGPPFNFTLAHSNPSYIFTFIRLKFKPRKYVLISSSSPLPPTCTLSLPFIFLFVHLMYMSQVSFIIRFRTFAYLFLNLFNFTATEF